MKFKGIEIGVNSRTYRHDLSHDVSTTLGFGNVLPLMAQYMQPGDSIHVDARQLLRLAPMPCPTYGKINLHNKAVFVSAEDILPIYQAVLAEEPIRSQSGSVFKSKSFPFITPCELAFMFILSDFFYYAHFFCESGSGTITSFDDYGFLSDFFKGNSRIGNDLASAISDYNPGDTLRSINKFPSLDGFDLVVHFSTIKYGDCWFCGRLSAAGRRVWSILRSLGYCVDFSIHNRLDILRLIAFHKCWFDVYNINDKLTWQTSNAHALMQVYSNSGDARVGFLDSYRNSFVLFLKDLSNLFASENLDFNSAHKRSINDAYVGNLSMPVVGSDMPNDIRTSSAVAASGSSVGDKPVMHFSSIFDKIGLDMLTKLSYIVNKDTILGRNIEQWVRVHYGDYAAKSLFAESNIISSWTVISEISDVISQSDTASSAGTGEFLGAYAGRGIGFDSSNFSYKSSNFGWFFIISSVNVIGGYTQGFDPSLLGLDRYTLPNSEFDALGYDVTPFGAVYDGFGFADVGNTGLNTTFGSTSFGFIPRYSAFKCKKNVLSGDFCRRSTMGALLPYTVDHIITPPDVRLNGKLHQVVNLRIPAASPQWRVTCGNPALSNYNRIFYNVGPTHGEVYSQSNINLVALPIREPVDDNFILHSVFKVDYRSKLKPMSRSFDTFDKDVDNNSMSVTGV